MNFTHFKKSQSKTPINFGQKSVFFGGHYQASYSNNTSSENLSLKTKKKVDVTLENPPSQCMSYVFRLLYSSPIKGRRPNPLSIPGGP
jgi:hypothetical protein